MRPGNPYGPPKFKNMKLDMRKGGNSEPLTDVNKEEVVPEAAPENN